MKEIFENLGNDSVPDAPAADDVYQKYFLPNLISSKSDLYRTLIHSTAHALKDIVSMLRDGMSARVMLCTSPKSCTIPDLNKHSKQSSIIYRQVIYFMKKGRKLIV